MSETPTPPPAPEQETPSETPPRGPQSESGIDWRLLVIVGIAVLLVVAAVVNRKYYGKKRPEAPGKLAAKGQPVEPPGPVLNPVDAYAKLLTEREAEAKGTLFSVGGRTLMVAIPPRFVTRQNDPQTLERVEPGRMFDLTKLDAGLKPEMFFRRGVYAPAEGVAYMDAFVPLGIPNGPQPDIKPAREVNLNVLADDQVIVGIKIGDQARAYPVKMLNHHDVINDSLGGTPIVLAWSAIAYGASAMTRVLPDGKTAFFGSAGLLYQSAIVLYDVDALGLWSATERRCLSGERAGATLKPVQTVMTTWKTWKEMFPDTTALVGTNPSLPVDYEKNAAIPDNYLRHLGFLYPVYGTTPEKSSVRFKWPVFGVTGPDGKSTKAYEVNLMVRELKPAEPAKGAEAPAAPVLEDTIGGKKVLIQFDPKTYLFVAKDESGAPLLTESMLWIAWVGAHPDTEIWQEAKLRAMIHPPTTTTLPGAETPAPK